MAPKNPLKTFHILKFDLGNTGNKYALKNVTVEISDPISVGMLRFLKIERKSAGYSYDLNPHIEEAKKLEVVRQIDLGTINVNSAKPFYVVPFKNIELVNLPEPISFVRFLINTDNTIFDYYVYFDGANDNLEVKKVLLKENNVEIDHLKYFRFIKLEKPITHE